MGISVVFKKRERWIVVFDDCIGVEIIPLDEAMNHLSRVVNAYEETMEELAKEGKNAMIVESFKSEILSRKITIHKDKSAKKLGYNYLFNVYFSHGSAGFFLKDCNLKKMQELYKKKIKRIIVSEENGIEDIEYE